MFLLSETGPEIQGNKVRFRILLPGIEPPAFTVKVYIISKPGQFDVNIPALIHELQVDPILPGASGNWGDIPKNRWVSNFVTLPPGVYLYRFEISGPSPDEGNSVRSLYFGDPFARETDAGIFSVCRLPAPPQFAWNDINFQVPPLDEIILYELNVAEFGTTFGGVAERIPYLVSLGVNVIELMPVNSIAEPNRWGYVPVFYLAPEERFGGPGGLKELVKSCHAAGIAVILDMVYAHADRMFPYQIGYERFFHLWQDDHYFDGDEIHRSPNPMVSAWDEFGKKNDWRMNSVREFFKAANAYWMNEYHIDGFRYDHVNGYLDRNPVIRNGTVDWYSQENRPVFVSLRELTNASYEESKDHPRFTDMGNGPSRLIQIAEDLGQSAYQLSPVSGSAINGNWEKSLALIAKDMAINDTLSPDLGRELLMTDDRYTQLGYSGIKTVGADTIQALPVQYFESHDENRLFNLMQRAGNSVTDGYDYRNGLDGEPWWKLQPYAIALLTCTGIPMLFAGQEFAENTGVAETGMVRVRGLRPLHWDYFYNEETTTDGATVLPLVTLYRKMGKLRKDNPALRSGRINGKTEYTDIASKILVYRRWKDGKIILVILNFAEYTQDVPVIFGHPGIWTDILDAAYNDPAFTVDVGDPSGEIMISVPGNFGRVMRIGI